MGRGENLPGSWNGLRKGSGVRRNTGFTDRRETPNEKDNQRGRGRTSQAEGADSAKAQRQRTCLECLEGEGNVTEAGEDLSGCSAGTLRTIWSHVRAQLVIRKSDFPSETRATWQMEGVVDSGQGPTEPHWRHLTFPQVQGHWRVSDQGVAGPHWCFRALSCWWWGGWTVGGLGGRWGSHWGDCNGPSEGGIWRHEADETLSSQLAGSLQPSITANVLRQVGDSIKVAKPGDLRFTDNAARSQLIQWLNY